MAKTRAQRRAEKQKALEQQKKRDKNFKEWAIEDIREKKEKLAREARDKELEKVLEDSKSETKSDKQQKTKKSDKPPKTKKSEQQKSDSNKTSNNKTPKKLKDELVSKIKNKKVYISGNGIPPAFYHHSGNKDDFGYEIANGLLAASKNGKIGPSTIASCGYLLGLGYLLFHGKMKHTNFAESSSMFHKALKLAQKRKKKFKNEFPAEFYDLTELVATHPKWFTKMTEGQVKSFNKAAKTNDYWERIKKWDYYSDPMLFDLDDESESESENEESDGEIVEKNEGKKEEKKKEKSDSDNSESGNDESEEEIDETIDEKDKIDEQEERESEPEGDESGNESSNDVRMLNDINIDDIELSTPMDSQMKDLSKKSKKKSKKKSSKRSGNKRKKKPKKLRSILKFDPKRLKENDNCELSELKHYHIGLVNRIKQVLKFRMILANNYKVKNKSPKAKYSGIKGNFNSFNHQYGQILMNYNAYHYLKPKLNDWKTFMDEFDESVLKIRLDAMNYNCHVGLCKAGYIDQKTGERLKPFIGSDYDRAESELYGLIKTKKGKYDIKDKNVIKSTTKSADKKPKKKKISGKKRDRKDKHVEWEKLSDWKWFGGGRSDSEMDGDDEEDETSESGSGSDSDSDSDDDDVQDYSYGTPPRKRRKVKKDDDKFERFSKRILDRLDEIDNNKKGEEFTSPDKDAVRDLFRSKARGSKRFSKEWAVHSSNKMFRLIHADVVAEEDNNDQQKLMEGLINNKNKEAVTKLQVDGNKITVQKDLKSTKGKKKMLSYIFGYLVGGQIPSFCEILVDVLNYAESTKNLVNKDWKSLTIQRLLSDRKLVGNFTKEVAKILNEWDAALIRRRTILLPKLEIVSNDLKSKAPRSPKIHGHKEFANYQLMVKVGIHDMNSLMEDLKLDLNNSSIDDDLFYEMLNNMFADANQNGVSMKSIIINGPHSKSMTFKMRQRLSNGEKMSENEWLKNVHSDFDSAQLMKYFSRKNQAGLSDISVPNKPTKPPPFWHNNQRGGRRGRASWRGGFGRGGWRGRGGRGGRGRGRGRGRGGYGRGGYGLYDRFGPRQHMTLEYFKSLEGKIKPEFVNQLQTLCAYAHTPGVGCRMPVEGNKCKNRSGVEKTHACLCGGQHVILNCPKIWI